MAADVFEVPMHFYCFHPVRKSTFPVAVAGVLALILTTGCGTPGMSSAQPHSAPTVADAAAATALGASTPPVLLFVGMGTSSGSVAAVKTLLGNLNLAYATATSSQLNAMSVSQLTAYKLLFVPGGNAITISKNLTHTATQNIHNAIVNYGLHYVGICAGGFFAGSSGVYNYLSLTSNVWFNYYADEFNGIYKAAVEVRSSNGTKLDQYWENGPQFSGWGQVVGKYPDGTPAIVEGKAGNGWVILCGVHPEATDAWRTGMTFTTPASVDNAYGQTMIAAALAGTVLPHY